NRGQIDLLGGFLHYGEDPEEGARREIKEEIGKDVKILDLLGIYMDTYYYQDENISTLNFVYIGVFTDDTEIKVADDVAEVFWQPINEVPEKVAFKVIQESLEDLKKWYSKNGNH